MRDDLLTIGVSLKMYLGHAETLQWATDVAVALRESEAVRTGRVTFFAAPSFVCIKGLSTAFLGTGGEVGAQDLSAADSGAFTGEVSGRELKEVGVTFAEVGHAERRRLFGETDEIVAAKVAAALRNGLTPVLCVGESWTHRDDATTFCLDQIESALHEAPEGRLVVAYEPVWAIGKAEPAPADHIRHVCEALKTRFRNMPGREGSHVIYGGSARPGMLRELGGSVDGLFLGRFAHDPNAVRSILQEASSLIAEPDYTARRKVRNP